jgi:hypothetical protein
MLKIEEYSYLKTIQILKNVQIRKLCKKNYSNSEIMKIQKMLKILNSSN